MSRATEHILGARNDILAKFVGVLHGFAIQLFMFHRSAIDQRLTVVNNSSGETNSRFGTCHLHFHQGFILTENFVICSSSCRSLKLRVTPAAWHNFYKNSHDLKESFLYPNVTVDFSAEYVSDVLCIGDLYNAVTL